MITNLTLEQEKGIEEWRDLCLGIGRDTTPVQKSVVEKAWIELYKTLGYGKPKFWYCQSPLQAQIIINSWGNIRENILENIEVNIGENIRVNIWENILENIEVNIWENIEQNIWENIRVNIEENIWENIRENIRGNIEQNIEQNIEENIRVNIGENIRGNIRVNIWENIRANIGENIRANIWENIRGNIERTNYAYIPTYSYCQHDIYWISYFLYYKKYGLLKNDENFRMLDYWFDLSKSCGWCYNYKNIIFVCEKPSEIYINSSGELHKDGGKAICYSDGYGLYALNGTIVPEYLAITQESELNLDFFKNEENADVKAEFLKKYGVSRMLSMGKEIDSYKNYKNNFWWTTSKYKLIDMAPIFQSIDFAPHIYMENQTIKGLFHLEAVAPECKNLQEAIHWRENTKKTNYKTINIK